MATYTIVIEEWKPTSVNKLLRTHPKARGRLLRLDAAVVTLAARAQNVPRAAGKRRLSLLVEMPGRLADADNFLKVGIDSAVAAGVLKDDSPRWLELGAVEVRRGERVRTVYTIEELA